MKKSFAEKKTCLIIEWLDLPEAMQDIIAERERFQNNCLLEHHSEFSIEDFKRGKPVVEEYYKDQIARTDEYADFKGSYEEFIERYGLTFDVWLMEQKLDLEGVDEILIRISW